MHFYRARTVLITGASSGIGEAMARLLAPYRPHLLLVARSEDALDALAADCRAEGARAEVFAHDLAEPGSAQALFDRVAAAGHHVDVLINNAGFGKLGDFIDYPAATYEQMVTLNVTTLTALTRLFLEPMAERGSGGILNVASLAAYLPAPYFAVYAATKAYVFSFTEALHAELKGSGVHLTALAPGPVATNFAEAADMKYLVGGPVISAEKAARAGLEALTRNQRAVLPSLLTKVTAWATRLVPKAPTLAITGRLIRRASVQPTP